MSGRKHLHAQSRSHPTIVGHLFLAVIRCLRVSGSSGILCSLVLPLCNEGLRQTAMIQWLLCIIGGLRSSASRCWRRRCSVCCPQGRRSRFCVRGGLLQQPARALPQAGNCAYLPKGNSQHRISVSVSAQTIQRDTASPLPAKGALQEAWFEETFSSQLFVRALLLSVFSRFQSPITGSLTPARLNRQRQMSPDAPSAKNDRGLIWISDNRVAGFFQLRPGCDPRGGTTQWTPSPEALQPNIVAAHPCFVERVSHMMSAGADLTAEVI